MGNKLSEYKSYFFPNKEKYNILTIGFDGSGKTAIIHRYKYPNQKEVTIPTIGYNLETFNYKGHIFTLWDCGGQEKVIALWRHYFSGLNAIIFVLD